MQIYMFWHTYSVNQHAYEQISGTVSNIKSIWIADFPNEATETSVL